MLDLHEGVLGEFAERGSRALDSYAGMSVGTNPNPRDERSAGEVWLEGDVPGGLALAARQSARAAAYRPWSPRAPKGPPKKSGPVTRWTSEVLEPYRGQPYLDIAKALGCSRNTVANYFRGLKKEMAAVRRLQKCPCSRPVKARGLCEACYMRNRRRAA